MPRRKGRLNLREEFTVGKACYVVEFENNELSFHADVLKSGTAAYHMSSFERAFGDDPPDAIWTDTGTGHVFEVKRNVCEFFDKVLRRYKPYYFTFTAIEVTRVLIYKWIAAKLCARYGYSVTTEEFLSGARYRFIRNSYETAHG